MKNVMKKSLIMALAVMMTFVFSFSTSFAGTGSGSGTLNYVAIGSSTANGFGLKGYDRSNLGLYDKNNDPVNVPNSYPRLVQNYLGENTAFTNLCPEGLRTNELRAILEYTGNGDDYYSQNVNTDTFLKAHLNDYFKTAFLLENTAGMTELKATFTDAISNADVITLDACDNNFGTYLGNRLLGMFSKGTGYNQSIASITDLPPNVRTLVSKAETESLKFLNQALSRQGDPLDATMTNLLGGVVDALVYCAAACCVNFTADVQDIYELNPDVNLVVFGVSNPLQNVWVEFNDEKIDLGKIAQIYIDAVNTYIRALDPNSNKYKYAYCPNYEILYDACINAMQYIDFTGKLELPKDIMNITLGVSSDSDFVINNEKSYKYNDYKNYVDAAERLGTEDNPINVDSLIGAIGAMTTGNEDIPGIIKKLEGEVPSLIPMIYYLEARFLAFDHTGIGAHPTIKGHNEKFDAIKTAYESGDSSREAFFNEIQEKLYEHLHEKIDELGLEDLTLKDIDEYIISLSVYKDNETEVKSAVALACEKIDEFKAYAIEGTELDKALKQLTPEHVKNLTVKDIKTVAKTLAAAIEADAKVAAEYAEGTLCLGKDLTALIGKAESLPEEVLAFTEANFEATLNAAKNAIEAIGKVAIEDTKDVGDYVLKNSNEYIEYLLTDPGVGQKIQSFEVDFEELFEAIEWFKGLSSNFENKEYEDAVLKIYGKLLEGYEYFMANTVEERAAIADAAIDYYNAVSQQAVTDATTEEAKGAVEELVNAILDIVQTEDAITADQLQSAIDAVVEVSQLDFTNTINATYENCPEKIKNCELIEMYRDTLNTVLDEGQKVYNALNTDIQNVYEGVSEEFADGVNAGKAAAIAVYKLVEASYADVAEKETLNEAAMVALKKANEELKKLEGDYTILHTLEKVPGQAATTTATGIKEHYECTKCGKLFWDEAGLKPIADESDIIIPIITVAVTGVTLDTSLSLTVGNSKTLTATVSPASATNKAVTWSSNNTSVATVDENGKVTAKGAGTATITVTTADGNMTATCTVTVKSSGGGYTPSYYPIGGGSVTPTTPAEEKPPVEEKTLEEKKAEAKAELKASIADNGFKAKSAKQTKLNGKKALKISWTKVEGADGYEVFRSTKKYSGFGTKPFFTTKKTTYTNNKNLKAGKTYYYKVRAYKLVDGEKVYSEWSLKAWRKIK